MMATKKTIKSDTKTLDTSVEEKNLKKDDSKKADNVETEDPLKVMEAKLESLEQEAKENHDRFLRVSAEFENYKKRAAREMNEFRKFANESFVKAILTVVDNLDRAIESSDSDEHVNSSVVEGVHMTLKEILKVFEQFSVKPFESIGKMFDPSLHQAVAQEETDEYPENSILKELQKGYMMHDRLLRPAMVIVAKAKSENRQNTVE